MEQIIFGEINLVIAGLAVLLGLITGSFLNVVIYRLPAGKSVIYPRSRCLNCGHMLKTGDLVPVLSYVWLKGRCRYCGEKILIQYPVIELLTAAGFWLIYLKWNISFFTLSGWLLTSVLIVCAAVDRNMGIIPNLVTYPGMMLGLLLSCFTVGIPSAFSGALLLGGILLLTAFLSRGGMGGGDIKLGFLIGAFTGLPGAFLAFVVSSLSGGAWAVYLLSSRKAEKRSPIKFGPFLAVGGWLAFVCTPEIINSYLTWLSR